MSRCTRDSRHFHGWADRFACLSTICINFISPPKSVKFQEKDGCFLCGREEANSQKRRSLAQNELLQKVCQLLPVMSDLLKTNSHQYVYETPCYRDLEKFSKLEANIETLRSSLLKRFEGAQQCTKRCLPSDVTPHQSPDPKRQS